MCTCCPSPALPVPGRESRAQSAKPDAVLIPVLGAEGREARTATRTHLTVNPHPTTEVTPLHPSTHRIYLNDLTTTHAVRYAPTQKGTYIVEGLPLIRVGTWNGAEYSPRDLIAMADNFSALQQQYAFEPGLWPRHNYDHQGNIIPQNADEALGFYRSMRYDPTSRTLLGDVEVFDERTATDMARGKLRYISAEIKHTEQLGPTVTGAAFVPDPAVKGMPWHIVVNAADYGVVEDGENGVGQDGRPTRVADENKDHPTPQGGLLDMNVLQKLLRGSEPADDRPDADAGGTVMQAAHCPDVPAPETTTREALQAEIATLRAQYQEALAQHRSEQADARVEKWIGCGYLPPACREQARALVLAAMHSGDEIVILSEDGSEAKARMVDVLEEVLRVSAPSGITGGGRGMVFNGSLDPDDDAAQRAAGMALAEAVGGKKQ